MQLYWIPPAALSILVVYQQYRFYRVHRESKRNEELFKIVTEDAADMIALVDTKATDSSVRSRPTWCRFPARPRVHTQSRG